MSTATAILAFSAAVAVLTITPGLDTALVLRTAAVEGPRPAWRAGVGIVCGVLAWGLLVALGLGALLAVSEVAYGLLQMAGAAYLLYLGARLLWTVFTTAPVAFQFGAASPSSDGNGGAGWFLRGLLTNLLNPKVGVFYVSLLPQFMPAQADVLSLSVVMAGIHAAMGLVWFGALILATRPLAGWLRRPSIVHTLNAMTGMALMLFGLRLALSKPGT
ncbi:LysE family translocator [Caldimonas manganoxidans]|uniref:LysE family translocator n=1 Tax=Caldimonas manganoxidans TaxID=196015 RepID=UPI000381AD51|nr:LysE family translocator [Caldimonas manganoxidans]